MQFEKYKGYEVSVNKDGEFEGSKDEQVCAKADTLKSLKERLDRQSKKAFKPFIAYVREGSYWNSREDEVRKFKKVTVTSVSPLTGKVYFKQADGDSDQDSPSDVFQDTPENIKLMDEIVRLETIAQKADKAFRAAEEKALRIDVKPWIGKDEN